MSMKQEPKFKVESVKHLRQISEDVGGLFFSRDTMQFFGTRLPDDTIYGGDMFITHERKAPEGVPQFYVRQFEVELEGSVPKRVHYKTLAQLFTLGQAHAYCIHMEKHDLRITFYADEGYGWPKLPPPYQDLPEQGYWLS